jgi:DNA-binding NarL/FixJ family response regulator
LFPCLQECCRYICTMAPIKVCIVEDLKDVRDGIISLLTLDDRFEVLCGYENAEIAEEELPAWQPDIVIMDINLPGMSGIECIKKVKAACPRTQFIMFTIYEDDEKVFEALSAGASGYLLKKTNLGKIADSLEELHEGGSPMSTQIARKVIQSLQKQNELAEESKLLTAKEHEVLHLLAKGHLYKEISVKLNISVSTVKKHLHKVYQKLHVNNRTEAINKIYRN